MSDVTPQRQEQFRVLLRLTRDWFETRRSDRRTAVAERGFVPRADRGREPEPDEISRYGADPPWI